MERLFGSIPDILQALGHDGGAMEALVFAAWRQCAGDLISERTEPLEFFENRLVVAVSDATWRMHLEDLAPQMIAKLNMALEQGTVKFIEFRIDASAFKDREQKPDKGEDVEMDVPSSLAQAAAAISDDDLRESFLKAAAVYLAKE